MRTLAQYGMQRTGTNVVKALVETNFTDMYVDDSHKHERWDQKADEGAEGHIVHVKDPASWVAAFWRYKVMLYGEKRMGWLESHVDEWLLYWRNRTLSHLQLARIGSPLVLVQHEQILRDPYAILGELQEAFGLEWASPHEPELFLLGYAQRGARRYGAQIVDRSQSFDRGYHLEGRWADDIPLPVLEKCRQFSERFFGEFPELRQYFDLSHVPRRNTVRLSATIMAHPKRQRWARDLRRRLDRRIPVVYDRVNTPSEDPEQRWATGRRAWQSFDGEADWHMVIQDDAIVCRDLLAGLEMALGQLGDRGCMSPYTGIGRPDQHSVRKAFAYADEKGHSWAPTRSLNWGVAICLPTWVIPDMLDWCDQQAGQPYDYRIGRYVRDVMGWCTWYPVPSVVDHRDEQTLCRFDHEQHERVAHRMHQGSALDIPWSVTPPKFSPYVQ